MSSPNSNSTLRQRGTKDKAKVNGLTGKADVSMDAVLDSTKQAVTKEWDYKLALTIITTLSFITRFLGITHPDEVVFDEVHFGKVRISTSTRKQRSRLTPSYSSLPTTSNAPTSSMSTLPLANSSSPLLAGWWATMESSSSRTLASPTTNTMSRTSPTGLCLRFWAPSLCPRCS